MPLAHQAYLLLVLAGFVTFGVTLGYFSWWSNRGGAKRAAPTAAHEHPAKPAGRLAKAA